MRGFSTKLAVLFGAICGCTPARTVPALPHLEASELSVDRVAHVAVRAPTGAVKQTLSILVRDEISGKGFEGRGVVAVRPRSALRMILLGPGGTTAMDVWIRGKPGGWEEFRVSIPALGRVVRGDPSTPRAQLRGMPVELLWRWIVDPFGGALVHARRGLVRADGTVTQGDGLVAWVLRGHTMEVRTRFGPVDAPEAQGWWVERGRVTGTVSGTEARIAGTDALFPVVVVYRSYDPPMSVRVQGEATELATIPSSTFEDPDR